MNARISAKRRGHAQPRRLQRWPSRGGFIAQAATDAGTRGHGSRSPPPQGHSPRPKPDLSAGSTTKMSPGSCSPGPSSRSCSLPLPSWQARAPAMNCFDVRLGKKITWNHPDVQLPTQRASAPLSVRPRRRASLLTFHVTTVCALKVLHKT